VAKLFDIKVAGLNVIREVEYLSMIKDNPVRPFTLIIGGAKKKTK
jgi:3-phosphoglycerate kinase